MLTGGRAVPAHLDCSAATGKVGQNMTETLVYLGIPEAGVPWGGCHVTLAGSKIAAENAVPLGTMISVNAFSCQN